MRKCPCCRMKIYPGETTGESALYRSHHILCEACYFCEDDFINHLGTNDIPSLLRYYNRKDDNQIYNPEEHYNGL